MAVTFEQLHQLANSTIRQRARWVVRKARLPRYERHDVEQELWLALWERHTEYDERVPMEAFVQNVVKSKACKLIRRYVAAKRCGGTVESTGYDGMLATQLRSHRGVEGRAMEQQFVLREDVQTALEDLPEQTAHIARLLMEQGPAEAARHLGISRSTVERARKRIAEHLHELGIDEEF
jgi:RNA polymerase sigma factor (sigma-70 family)